MSIQKSVILLIIMIVVTASIVHITGLNIRIEDNNKNEQVYWDKNKCLVCEEPARINIIDLYGNDYWWCEVQANIGDVTFYFHMNCYKILIEEAHDVLKQLKKETQNEQDNTDISINI